MKILFDLFFAQPIGSSKFHGGGEYIKTVFRQVVFEKKLNQIIIVYFDRNKYLDDWILALIDNNDIKVYDVKSLQDVERIFINEEIDVFYTGMPYKYYKISIPRTVKKIGTFHGLRFAEKPSDRYARYYLVGINAIKQEIKYRCESFFRRKAQKRYQSGLDVFDEIVTVSRHTKYAIASMCNLTKTKCIHVLYTPAKYTEYNEEESYEDIPEKYILIVGGNRWEKNSARVICAIEELLENNKLHGYQVVIVGRLPKKVKRFIHHLENYVLFDYVESEKLEMLYKHCDFFIYASLNEGFGMPPMEAMRYGKTCIVSGVCSLPEVCGNGVYYVNPYDINEIENRILCATQEKIDVARVKDAFKITYERQQEDLKKIAELILCEKE